MIGLLDEKPVLSRERKKYNELSQQMNNPFWKVLFSHNRSSTLSSNCCFASNSRCKGSKIRWTQTYEHQLTWDKLCCSARTVVRADYNGPAKLTSLETANGCKLTYIGSALTSHKQSCLHMQSPKNAITLINQPTVHDMICTCWNACTHNNKSLFLSNPLHSSDRKYTMCEWCTAHV